MAVASTTCMCALRRSTSTERSSTDTSGSDAISSGARSSTSHTTPNAKGDEYASAHSSGVSASALAERAKPHEPACAARVLSAAALTSHAANGGAVADWAWANADAIANDTMPTRPSREDGRITNTILAANESPTTTPTPDSPPPPLPSTTAECRSRLDADEPTQKDFHSLTYSSL